MTDQLPTRLIAEREGRGNAPRRSDFLADLADRLRSAANALMRAPERPSESPGPFPGGVPPWERGGSQGGSQGPGGPSYG